MTSPVLEQTIEVQLGQRAYPVVVTTRNIFERVTEWSQRQSKGTVLVVADTHTSTWAEPICETLLRQGWRLGYAHLPAGEATKSLHHASELYEQLASMGADRQTLLVAVGGGVIGDLVGFVAATFMRGLRWIGIPTSLLAMVDSSVGGKVGINLPAGKNLVGAFHQPMAVWCALPTLETLPEREYRSGLAEVAKYGFALDASFFNWLEGHVEPILHRDANVLLEMIARCVQLKANIVSQDEYETTGLRMKLNFGHTFAHALEAWSHYGRWLHGEAVAIGMVLACRLAERLGRGDAALTAKLSQLLQSFGLPMEADIKADADALMQLMQTDKKRAQGQWTFILPSSLGQVEALQGVAEADVRQVLLGTP